MAIAFEELTAVALEGSVGPLTLAVGAGALAVALGVAISLVLVLIGIPGIVRGG